MKYTDEHILAENIDITKSKLNAKQNQILSSPISVLEQEQTTVEGALGAINNKERVLTQAEYDALSSAEKNNGTTYYIEDAAGGSEKEVINGYLNPSDGKFYEESTYETEISSTEEVLYIDLNTEKIYRYSDTDSEYIMVGGSGDDVSEEIADIVNVYSAKNLIPYPYYDTTKTQNGITFTDNGDGTISVNGTATENTSFSCSTARIDGKCVLPNGNYIVNGCPSDGSASSYRMIISRMSNGSPTPYGSDLGSGLTLTLDGDDYGVNDVRLRVAIFVASGTTVNNLTFRPMIRCASISDNTYQPYSKTNRELTIDNAEQQTEVNDIVNVYGAKNINSYPYAYTTREINGIAFTDNGDGTVIANGTATADAQFNFHERLITSSSNLILSNGDYIISGCPSGGATTKYYINANMTKNGNPTVLGTDIGNGATITLNGDDYSQDNVHLGFFIKIKSGQTVSNLLFKPMIRLASIKDDTYEPYAKTNIELTKDKAEQKEVNDINNVYGAKNLLRQPYFMSKLSNHYIHGVSVNVQEDGSIIVNGTVSESNVNIYLTNVIDDNRFAGKILSGCPQGGNGEYYLRARVGLKDDTYVSQAIDNGNGVVIPEIDTETQHIQIGLIIATNATVNNVVFKPMIREASVVDDTYEPYVPTNEQLVSDIGELTENTGVKNFIPYPYWYTTNETNGITFTDNGDGTVEVSGTASDLAQFTIVPRTANAGLKIPKGTYILSGCPSGGYQSTGVMYRLNCSFSNSLHL